MIYLAYAALVISGIFGCIYLAMHDYPSVGVLILILVVSFDFEQKQ